MKSLLLALAAAVVGTAGGFAASWWRSGSPGSGDPFDVAALNATDVVKLPSAGPTGPAPRVVVTHKEGGSKGSIHGDSGKELVFDFGVMPQQSSGSVEFLFRNEGEGPLKLSKGKTTCQCTLSELSETDVAPGGVATVKVNWKTEGSQGPYRHRADILTNDPGRPEVHLVVSGTLVQNVRIEPHALAFGRFSFREPQEREFTVVAFQGDDFKLQNISLVGISDDPTASGDPLAKLVQTAHRPLTADELKRIDALAKSGYRVTLSLKPGLPLGRFERRIRLTTNLPTPAYVHVTGTAAGDVSVAEGGAWIPDLELFHLGEADGATGVSKRLFLIVGGANYRDVQVKVKQTLPAELQAKIGTHEPGNGIMRWSIAISIPPGTPPMSHAEKGEYGQVILETTHPDHKELVIPVSFLVTKPRP